MFCFAFERANGNIIRKLNYCNAEFEYLIIISNSVSLEKLYFRVIRNSKCVSLTRDLIMAPKYYMMIPVLVPPKLKLGGLFLFQQKKKIVSPRPHVTIIVGEKVKKGSKLIIFVKRPTI